MLYELPATMAMTSLNPGGGTAWPRSSLPQPTTVPSDRSASTCHGLADTATEFTTLGGTLNTLESEPPFRAPHTATLTTESFTGALVELPKGLATATE